jgi:predicted helicase
MKEGTKMSLIAIQHYQNELQKVIDLLMRVTTVSVETVKIVREMEDF